MAELLLPVMLGGTVVGLLLGANGYLSRAHRGGSKILSNPQRTGRARVLNSRDAKALQKSVRRSRKY